jgi:hypothetical protein
MQTLLRAAWLQYGVEYDVVVLTGSIPAATVAIDGSQNYQVVDGFGVDHFS